MPSMPHCETKFKMFKTRKKKQEKTFQHQLIIIDFVPNFEALNDLMPSQEIGSGSIECKIYPGKFS